MILREKAKELNLFGIPYSWKEKSLRVFLLYNGYKIVNKDYIDFEYADIKGYLDLEIEVI